MLSVSSFSAASYDKCIFVIGGGPNGKLATNNMQSFDSLSNKWSLKCPMPTEAKCTNAVTFKDAIFVVGLYLLHFLVLMLELEKYQKTTQLRLLQCSDD